MAVNIEGELPDTSVRIESIHTFVDRAINGNREDQKRAVSSLRDIQQASLNRLHFVNILQELWSIEKDDSQDDFHEEFNLLASYLSGIGKSCAGLAQLVREDDEFQRAEMMEHTILRDYGQIRVTAPTPS